MKTKKPLKIGRQTRLDEIRSSYFGEMMDVYRHPPVEWGPRMIAAVVRRNAAIKAIGGDEPAGDEG